MFQPRSVLICFLSIIKAKEILLIDTNGFKVHTLNIIHVHYKPRNPLSVCTEQIFNLAWFMIVLNKSMSFCGLPKDNAR